MEEEGGGGAGGGAAFLHCLGGGAAFLHCVGGQNRTKALVQTKNNYGITSCRKLTSGLPMDDG